MTVNLPRRCKKCQKVKPATAFSRDASRTEGRFPWCTNCQHTSVASKPFQDTELPLNGHTCPVDDVPIHGNANRRFCSNTCREKVNSLRKKYGMSIQDFRRLVADAAGRCPICHQRPTSWQVDHNHASRMATGIVCINCNIGLLAYSGHDIGRVKALLNYLEGTPCERLGIHAEAPQTVTGNRQSTLQVRWGHNRFGKVKP